MTSIACVTDTHYGARKGSKIFHDYFKKFYAEIFFPELEKRNIKQCIHLGDAFDNRKSVDFWALNWAKENVYDKFRDLGITVYQIVGNHDAYYKNTNEVNSIESLLREYDNIQIIDEPTLITVGETPIWNSDLKKYVYGESAEISLGGQKEERPIVDPQADEDPSEELPF